VDCITARDFLHNVSELVAQENANASGVRTSDVHWHAIGVVEPTTRPYVLLIVQVRLTRRWENETKLPSYLEALLLSTWLVRQTRRGRGINAVETVYLSRDLRKHPIFRIESLPEDAERLPEIKYQVLIVPEKNLLP
jgi:hypothetical protein